MCKMKIAFIVSLLATSLSLQGEDILLFSNSDILHGKLASVDSEKGIVLWKHPDIDSPLSFKMDKINEIILTPVPAQGIIAKEIGVIIDNGDALAGKAEIMDKEKLILNTHFAGNLEIRKSHIRKIVPSPASKVIYRGPGNLQDWTTNKSLKKAAPPADADVDAETEEEQGVVEVDNGVMMLSGYQAFSWKDVRLPELSRIEFETTFSSSSTCGVLMYSEKVPPDEDKAFIAAYSPYSSGLGRFNNANWSDCSIEQNDDGDTAPAKIRDEWNRIIVLANMKEKSLTLIVNGKIRRQFNGASDDFTPKGTAICFFSIGDYGETIKIRNISIDEWDGALPVSQANEPAQNDTIFFVNKDKASGSLTQIKDDIVKFDTEFANLSVPIERISYIMMKTGEKEILPSDKESSKIFLENDNLMTLSISRISNGRLTGTSERFGNVSIDLKAISRISLNVFARKMDEASDNKKKTENE